jgi:Protein of unknown function (DUF1329)
MRSFFGVFATAAILSFAFAGRAAAEFKAGDVLGRENAAEATNLLPPEIAAFYQKGDWRNPIADWPDGRMRWDSEFLEGTRRNGERLALSNAGGIIDKETGERPERIVGFPFSKIDGGDPQAGTKILWNYFYGAYNLGNAQVNVDLTWLSRSGVDRNANVNSYLLIYDGQKAKYLPAKNPQNFLTQILASVTAPQDLYATTALTWRYRSSEKRDNVWAYVPALRRVREMSPVNRSDGFLGSEMTQDDGPFFDGKPEDFSWTLVEEKEMLRLADPHSLTGDTKVTARAEGGWRAHYAPGPFVGFEDSSWSGVSWAPVSAVLAKRRMWVIEGVPHDKYYLYGKIQLYIDRETFEGAWNRKFSRSGELLALYAVLGYLNTEVTTTDGSKEYFFGTGVAYNCAMNLKKDQATVTGFPISNRDTAENLIRVRLQPDFFDFQTLQRFGK